MRILVVAPRAPSINGKGDQVRLAQMLPALAEGHRVTLVHPIDAGPGALADPPPPGVETIAVSVTRIARARAALWAWCCGHPGQAGWFAPNGLRQQARRRAIDHDVVLYVTARTFTRVDAPVAVDHIDCLSENTALRATRCAHPIARLLWREEARRLRRWERRAARLSQAQIVTSPVDARRLPADPPLAVVPNGVPGSRRALSSDDDGRDIDLVLSGNMRYPPNRDAVLWLGREILPRLRELVAEPPRVVVAGRCASLLPALPGVEVMSDIPEIGAILRRSRVAIAPLRIGTGIPNKVLEAAHAGAAIVLTPRANAPLGLSPAAAASADDAEGLAREVARLISDPKLRRSRREATCVELARFDLTRVGRDYVGAVIAAHSG